jgi:hypothetical protein
VHRSRLPALALVVIAARVGTGQSITPVTDASIELGGAYLRQPGLTANGVLTAAAQYRYAGPEFVVGTNGIIAMTPDSRFSGQGLLTASRYASARHRLRWELTGTGSAFGVSTLAPSFAWQGVAREHLALSLGGIFAGVSGGTVAQAGVGRPILGAQAGGFVRLDPLGIDELSAALALTDAGVRPFVPGLVERVRYADAIAYWSHRGERIELATGGGVRAHSPRDAAGQLWGSASATLWMADRAAIVLAMGRALADESRGVPSVRYLSVGLRLASRAGRGAAGLPVRRAPRDEPGRLDVVWGADSSRVISVHSITANSIEIMADFTDWEPVPLASLPNGDWSVARVVAAGSHRIAMRVDGGAWIVPPNLPRVTDEFGGEVGIVIVP